MNSFLKIGMVFFAFNSFSASACLPQNYEALKNGDRECYEIMFTKEHVDCMTKHFFKIREAIIGSVKRKVASQSADDRRAADKKVYSAIESVVTECKQKQAEFGPGSLGERKRVFCINEGMKNLLLER